MSFSISFLSVLLVFFISTCLLLHFYFLSASLTFTFLSAHWQKATGKDHLSVYAQRTAALSALARPICVYPEGSDAAAEWAASLSP